VSGATRIALFAAAIAAVFGGTWAVGRAAGPIDRAAPSADHGSAMAIEGPAGLSVASQGFRLVPATTTLRSGAGQQLAFRILREDGSPLRDYEIEHERRLHLIVVGRGLTGFQHLHPRLAADGVWRVTTAPLVPGAYRAIADFATGGEKVALGVDLTVPGTPTRQALPHGEPYDVGLAAPRLHAGEETTLRFTVTRGGVATPLGDYLGAKGHLVILRAGDLGYLHTHPHDEALDFETTFPSAGTYRAFLQFRAAGQVRTASFELTVAQ
jgi:hypothetical protein